MKTSIPTDLADLPPVVPFVQAAAILGMGRSTAFEMYHRGDFPVRVLRLGRNMRVARADLLRYLGETA